MSKSKAKRKQATQQNGNAAKKLKPSPSVPAAGPGTLTPPSDTANSASPFEPKLLTSIISPEELEITVDTLQTLAAHPSLTKAKAAKDLRAAVFEFRRACTTGQASAALSDAANLTARISGALADGNLTEARVLLAEMRIRGQMPKLGALCRWVRDLDAISGLAEQRDGTVPRTEDQVRTLEVLDGILRVTGPVDYSRGKDGEEVASGSPMVVRETWNLREDERPLERVYASVLEGSLQASLPETTLSKFRILETTPGLERKPPNHHPAILHASQDNTIDLASPPPQTTHHKHPTVPNLHLMRDVLTPGECKQIIGAAERIGFTPDAPIRAEGEEISILAHNFYWIADEAFCKGVWDRVAPFVPSTVCGKKVRGLNRRMRVYRYVPGAEYRAHIGKFWHIFRIALPFADLFQMAHGRRRAFHPRINTYTTPARRKRNNRHYSHSSSTSTTSLRAARPPIFFLLLEKAHSTRIR